MSGQGSRVCLSVVRAPLFSRVLSGLESSDGWGPESGIEDGGTSLGFSASSPLRFSVRFKEGTLAVRVIPGPEGSENRKLICRKKGSNSMEVTVQ